MSFKEILMHFYLKKFYNSKKNKIKFFFNTKLNRNNVIGEEVYIGENVTFFSSVIGKRSYISRDCFIANALIGKYVSIAPNVKVVLGSHPTNKYVSTHPCFYSASSKNILGYSLVKQNRFQENKCINTEYGEKSIVIGNDVWIGSDVLVLEGVSVGDGAIIGAGSIVNKDIPPYSIYAGVPARFIRFRFSEDECKEIRNVKWWDWEDERLFNKIDSFNDIEKFLKEECK